MEDWEIYLAGEIHSDWRDRIREEANRRDLDVSFTAPVTDHQASDDCGARILGEPGVPFFRDQLGAGLNAIRTRTLIERADLVVVRFGEKYRQWNAAFDAGLATALDTPYITLHGEDIVHPLKEVDAAAMAWATTPEQVVDVLKYVIAR